MTAKEKLLMRVNGLSEQEAAAALAAMDRGLDDSELVALLAKAPAEDEEISDEEEAAVQEARDDLAAGEPTIPLEEVKRQHGLS